MNSLFYLAFAPFVAVADVRAETWALGVRYRGRVAEGARAERAAPDIAFRRAVLLTAVIRGQKGRSGAASDASSGVEP